MTLIIFDGPEAAGKSTIIEALQPDGIRRWGPVDSWRAYAEPLADDLADPNAMLAVAQDDPLIVWDRSWAAEVCYNELLKRGRTIDEWEIKRLYEEPVKQCGGLMVMVQTPYPVLTERRKIRLAAGKSGDLPLNPQKEATRFERYGEDHAWTFVRGDCPTLAAVAIIQRALKLRRRIEK